MDILSFLSDALPMILLTAAGLFLLIAPYGLIQRVFPNIVAKKYVKICGAIVLICGIGGDILLLWDVIAG